MSSAVDLHLSPHASASAYTALMAMGAARPQVKEPEAAQDSARVRISAAGRQLATLAAASPTTGTTAPLDADALRARSLAYGPSPLPALMPLPVAGESAAPDPAPLARQLEEVRDRRVALYEREKARGTPADEIYAQLQAFNAAQPLPFK